MIELNSELAASKVNAGELTILLGEGILRKTSFSPTAMLNIASRSLLRSSVRLARPNVASYVPTRSVLTLSKTNYTAHATATGAGRNGEVSSGGLDLKLASPGSSRAGQNPEQLFAMGYAGCLLGAIQFVAGGLGKSEMAKKAVVHTSVSLGDAEGLGGFGIAVDIKVEGVDDELLQAGHAFCPYSRALKHGAVVNISKA